jgi:hypothetical protein
MRVDDAYHWAKDKANLSAYLYSKGESNLSYIDFWVEKLLEQIDKLNPNGLALLKLPEA